MNNHKLIAQSNGKYIADSLIFMKEKYRRKNTKIYKEK